MSAAAVAIVLCGMGLLIVLGFALHYWDDARDRWVNWSWICLKVGTLVFMGVYGTIDKVLFP